MILFWTTIIFLFFPHLVHAKYDPRDFPNNKFGIHVADSNDIVDTAALVNSSGGDWGYVTVVIPQTDRNTDKWQEIFNRMRRLHLIPIVRLATELKDGYWIIPDDKEIRDWVTFLTSLNWPVENRYIVLFNEPNHAKEWGGTIDPEGYTKIVIAYARSLQSASEDFFILPAGLDASAASDGQSMDESEFLKRVVSNPDFMRSIDAWNSHSYPNPGFSASPYARGRGTLTTYLWELSLLFRLDNSRDLPVFITETGWSRANIPDMTIGQYVSSVSTSVWRDPDIVAITPFVFSYLTPPFEEFSWKIPYTTDYYPQYSSYQKISKISGQPRQKQKFTLLGHSVPDAVVSDSTYPFALRIKNEGQGIVNRHNYSVKTSTNIPIDIALLPLPTIEPDSEGEFQFVLRVPDVTGRLSLSLELQTPYDQIVLMNKDIMIISPPALVIRAQLGLSTANNAQNIKVLVYDKEEKLVYKNANVELKDGFIDIPTLGNVVPGETYRLVVVVPFYLPRQIILTIQNNVNVVSLKRFWPLDFDNDGALTISDFFQGLKQPLPRIRSLFLSHENFAQSAK